MVRTLLVVISFLLLTSLHAQTDRIYTTTETTLTSKFVPDTFVLDIHLPENIAFSDTSARFPLIVLFDNYNTTTHYYNLQTIETLTYHGQLPQSVVVGIPFTPLNRMYLTSTALRDGDSLTGIERMAHFLRYEMLPFLRDNYQAGAPVILMGHSRTAYLTSYLMLQHTSAWDAVGSFSGFTDEGFTPTKVSSWLDTLTQSMSYYFSAGKLLEEATYFDAMRPVAFLLDSIESDQINYRYQWTPAAGHMANYNLSVPWMLMDYFAPYAHILDNWLFGKGDRLVGVSAVDSLQQDFMKLSTHYGHQIRPEPLHIYSVGSLYWNKNDLEASVGVFQWGHTFYPLDYDLDYNIIVLLREMGKAEEAERWKRKTLSNLASDDRTPSDDRMMIQKAIEEL